MMKKMILSTAAAAAVVFCVSGVAPAQARMADPALSQTATPATTQVYYRHYRGGWRRHRHCWRGRYGRLHCGW
jgi:hypothetical protein